MMCNIDLEKRAISLGTSLCKIARSEASPTMAQIKEFAESQNIVSSTVFFNVWLTGACTTIEMFT